MVAQCKWGKECVFLAGFRCKFMHKATNITDLSVEVLAQRQLATERKLCVLQHRLALTAGSSRRQPRLEATQHRSQAQLQATCPISPPHLNFSPPPKAPSAPGPLSDAISSQPRPAPPQPSAPLEPPPNLQPEIQLPPPAPASPPQIIPPNSLVGAPPPNSPTTAPQSPSAATTSPSSRLPVRKVTPTNQSLSLKRKTDSPVEKTPALKKHSSPSRPSLPSVKPLSPSPTSSPKSPTLLELQHSSPLLRRSQECWDTVSHFEESVSMMKNPTRKQQRWAFEYFAADAKEQKPNSTTEEIAKAWMDLTPFDRIKYLVQVVCDRDTTPDDTPLTSPQSCPQHRQL